MHNAAGDLATVVYSDGTPGLSNTFDRLRRKSTVVCGATTTSFVYDLANDVLSESYTNGISNGLTVTNQFDPYLRRTNLMLWNGAPLVQATNSYDGASRLASVSDGTNSATYSYFTNSSLVSNIVFSSNATVRMTTIKQYDYLNRLSSISNSLSNSFAYQYNAANQRTMTWLWDGSYWRYGYDTLGQVASGMKYWNDETPVAGQQFDYTFDTIGNRTETEAGGDQNGANLRLANYTNNILNQITSRGVPGDVDVMGDALATNSVMVNGQTAYRKIEYFRQQLSVTNTTNAVWQNVTVVGSGQTNSGHLYVPQNPENYTYDADGNLLSDGRWSYTWDAENRLVGMTSLVTNLPSPSQFQLAFTYDYMGRRIQKIVSTNSSTNYIGQYTNNYTYDGWNCIAIFAPSLTLQNSFLWGLDLSGSMKGAGGVGGLLAENIVSNSVQFVAYDGNGNVSALVGATNGATTANYDYGPFGELLRATGPMAKLNPFRFSTKFDDDESDFLYYGHRYYNSSTGRFLSRDPMLSESPGLDDVADEYDYVGDENGGQMSFCGNNPVSEFDTLGLWPSSSPFLGILLGGIPLTHENANERELPISFEDKVTVDVATLSVDAAEHQSPADSYMHAMRDGTVKQSDASARALANNFVRLHLSNAEADLCKNPPDRSDALLEFGMALHTVQDSTSPAHNRRHNGGPIEFRPWHGTGLNPINDLRALKHVIQEDFDPGSGSRLDFATRDLYDKYFHCSACSAISFPPDFFIYGYDKRHGGYELP